MNEQRRDDAMDRDLDELAIIYRGTSDHDDEPPASLDSAILAAAHREVGSKPQSSGKSRITRWQVPLATAAVIVISSTVALIGVNELHTPATPSANPRAEIVQDAKEEVRHAGKSSEKTQEELLPEAMPKSMPAPAAAAQGSLPAKKQRVETPVVKADRSAQSADSPMPPQKPIPASPRQQAETEKDAVRIPPQMENSRRQAAGIRQVPAQSAPATTAFPAEEQAAASVGSDERHAESSQEAEMPPDAWLEKIERLYRRGHIDEARASLEEFRQAYPQYKIPQALVPLKK